MNRGLQDRFHPSTTARTRLAATALAASLALAACGADEPAASGQSSKPAGTAASASPSGTATDTPTSTTSTTDTPSPPPTSDTPTVEPAPTTSIRLGGEVPGLPADEAALAKFKAAGIDETCLVAGTRECRAEQDYLVNAAGTARVLTMRATENEGTYETKGWIALGYQGTTITSATYFPWKPGSGNGGTLVCGKAPTTVCAYQAGRFSGHKLELFKVSPSAVLTKIKSPVSKGTKSSTLISADGGVAYVDGTKLSNTTVVWSARILTPTGVKHGGCFRDHTKFAGAPPDSMDKFSAKAC